MVGRIKLVDVDGRSTARCNQLPSRLVDNNVGPLETSVLVLLKEQFQLIVESYVAQIRRKILEVSDPEVVRWIANVGKFHQIADEGHYFFLHPWVRSIHIVDVDCSGDISAILCKV